MNKRLIVLLLLIVILLLNPVKAEIVTAKVDDKGVIVYGYTNGVLIGTLHTDYGWIAVCDEDYNTININDTIRYDTDLDSFWMKYWTVELIK